MNLLENAEVAFAARDWAAAFDCLTELRERSALAAEDLDALAEAAWWLGRVEVAIEANEAAYQEFMEYGNTDGAVMSAIYLSFHHANKGAFNVGAAWLSRASRLIQKIPESPAAGYLGIVECGIAYSSGDFEGCLTKANVLTKMGESLMDATLIAWGLHYEGLALIKLGDLDRGWALLDEAMLEVSLRQMKPRWAGFLYCEMVQICDELVDPRRGWEWIEVAERWLSNFSSGEIYPGICRTYKAHIMQERGKWAEAESEARRVCDELSTLHIRSAARAFYEIGQIQRLRGDLSAAGESFKKAHQMGFEPQPGLADLRLAQGKVDVAFTQIEGALERPGDRLARAKLLPLRVEIAVAVGNLELAAEAADELSAVAAAYRSPGLEASAAFAHGLVKLAKSEPTAALADFREAVRVWSELDCPYQVALARTRSGEAHRVLRDNDRAKMEFEAAIQTFRTLGAKRDVHRTARLLDARHPGGLSHREIEVLRLVAAGKSNRSIAKDLSISENTVARHMSNIFVKLEVSSRAAGAAYAVEQGII